MDNPRIKANDDDVMTGGQAFLTALGFCAAIVCIMLTIKLGFVLFG